MDYNGINQKSQVCFSIDSLTESIDKIERELVQRKAFLSAIEEYKQDRNGGMEKIKNKFSRFIESEWFDGFLFGIVCTGLTVAILMIAF